MPAALPRHARQLAINMKSEFWQDKREEIEQALDELDDETLDIIEQQIAVFKTWYANRPPQHNKGPIAYELLSLIMGE